MTILYLITKSEAGGAQTHVSQLCEYFRAHHTVAVVAYPGGWLQEECKKLGVEFIPNPYFSNAINPFRILKSVFKLRSIVQTVCPDIVHCHSSVAGFLGRLVVRKRIPTVYTAHGWGFNTGVDVIQKYGAIFAELLVRRWTTAVICVSAFVRELGLKHHTISSAASVVIYNGVEVKERMPHRTQDDIIRLVFVGRLTAPKRPLLLLQALALCSSEMQKKVHITVVGEGEQNEHLDRYARAHPELSIGLTGSLPRKQVFDVLERSDIFVFLSDWEGFPMTILEAMSVGLPIIASDVGGVREMVNETYGILLKTNTVANVHHALSALIQDEALRKVMGEVSYQTVRDRFSLENMLQSVEELYTEISVS
jgi:glycosyltransferase involved in cell wall biosynthesis